VNAYSTKGTAAESSAEAWFLRAVSPISAFSLQHEPLAVQGHVVGEGLRFGDEVGRVDDAVVVDCQVVGQGTRAREGHVFGPEGARDAVRVVVVAARRVVLAEFGVNDALDDSQVRAAQDVA